MKSNKTITLSNGTVRHVASLSNEQLEREYTRFAALPKAEQNGECKLIESELTSPHRKNAQPPEYKPQKTAKVEVKDKDGKTHTVERVVGGYQPFSGGSRQCTNHGKQFPAHAPEWI